MNGEKTLYNVLKADPTILSLIENVEGIYDISISSREPLTWKPSYTTISIYNAVGVDNRNSALVTDITGNCRAGTEDKVKELASAFVDAVNLTNVDSGVFYTFTGGIIQPQDETDSYNLPITVTVKAVKELP